ncbi:AraC family transcriptional regulator [Couchioplanes caeruleus]|uniref:AraC family transcriptional regulator n=2 Tax=Couchioplanes caeruleus TaxID=56438 RepID=A0A1K0FE71_9ACTN|nr:AraC family transcriptional regulator [Couchioplanes caeruleus subsp. caeruleus]ROP33758.1 AraC family transcriptional regulator [Couchioplanes caeruleus]
MVIRSVAIHHVRMALRGARRRGVDTTAMLQAAGIPPGLLELDRARVSTEQFARLIRLLWDTLDDELLGLAAAPHKVGTFAMMCHAVVHCPDLRSALRRTGDFYRLFPDGPQPDLAESGDEASMSFVAGVDDPDHFLAETALVVWHRFAGWLIRRRISLRRVEFAYPSPPHALEYELLFGAPCVFEAGRTAAVFDVALLDEPVLQDEAGLRAFLRRAPADVLARIDYGSTVAARVRRVLSQSLPDRLPGQDEVAARLSVSAQTLRRQLAAEETSFQQVRDQLRRDVAVAALTGGRFPIEQLSAQLGFSEPSAFHRAFKRWTGSTPRSYQPG